MTAIGWRLATAWLTIRPVSGSATSFGVGVGMADGLGDGVGLSTALGAGDSRGAADGGVLPSPAIRPEPAGPVVGDPATNGASAPRPTPPRIAASASPARRARLIGARLGSGAFGFPSCGHQRASEPGAARDGRLVTPAQNTLPAS